MTNKIKLLFLALIICWNPMMGQSSSPLKSINELWAKFYKAFETLDHALMAEIHSKDLIRISGGERILDYDTYISGYQQGFEYNKSMKETNRIELRFFERAYSDSIASDRGIYKLIRNEGSDKEQIHYGEFHVLFKMESEGWKILMDYDSNLGNDKGEERFMNAQAIDSIEYFLKE